MRVIITGLPYFGKILQSDLANYDSKNSYQFFNTYYSVIDRIKFALYLPFSDVVISLNGVSDQSGSLDLAIKFKKKIMMLWQGTDVLLAQKRAKDSSINSKYIDYSTHFSDSKYLIEELQEIGINANLLYFKHLDSHITPVERYECISVYSYIAEGKEEFYGLDVLLPIFEKFPEIEFKIFGTNGKSYPKFANVTYYGWVDNDTYQDISIHTPIFIRLTEHDGYSRSVLEALSFGNEVIWNMKNEMCHFVHRDSIEVESKLSEVIQRLKNRELSNNTDNINWVKQNLSKSKIIPNFISMICTQNKKNEK